MRLDEFLGQLNNDDIRLPQRPSATEIPVLPPRTDALFHIPLLSLAIMVVARHHEFRVATSGNEVANLLTEHFSELREVHRTLSSSFTLRRRCAEALVFLEFFGLIGVSSTDDRSVSLTQKGKEFINRGRREDRSDTGILVRGLIWSQHRAELRRGTSA